ncbi:hypothetical protein P4S72_10865 [Vibrio sp. PP-XX7]
MIENDVTVMIGHDAHLTVENERFTQVKVDDHQSVDGEQRIKVAKNFSSEIQGDLQQKSHGAGCRGSGTGPEPEKWREDCD